MTWESPIARVVSTDMERVRLLEALHSETAGGRTVIVSQCVYRNVFTEFDLSLSRHMAAISGQGFPTVTLVRRFREEESDGGWTDFETAALPTLPDALGAIVDRAREFGETAQLRVMGETGEDNLTLTDDLAAAIADAARVAALLGDPAFTDVSGDFWSMMVSPAVGSPANLMIASDNASLPVTGPDGRGFEAPLCTFEHCARNHLGARRYLASVRQEEIAAKAKAVAAFRSAAETRILDLDRTMQGRPLNGHRLEMVSGLIARLRAGLGPHLRGLAEHAQITALDWAADVVSSQEAEANVWAAE